MADRECKNALHPNNVLHHAKNALNTDPNQPGQPHEF